MAIQLMACLAVTVSAVIAVVAWVLLFKGDVGASLAGCGAALLLWFEGLYLGVRNRSMP